MGLNLNADAQVVPVRERREISGTLANGSSELVLPINGDQFATLYVVSNSLIATLEFTGTVDGTNYFPILVYPHGTASIGGTLLTPGQPLLTHAVTNGNNLGYIVPCGQLKAVRVRPSAYTSGSGACIWVADVNLPSSLLPMQAPSTLAITATGAVSAAVTLTIPAVPGMRHVLTSLLALVMKSSL